MKEKSPESIATENAQDSANDNRLEAVRDLLFGQNDREYRKEFKQIWNDLETAKKELENKADALGSDLIDRLEKLEQKLTERVNSVESKLLEEVSSLKDDKVGRKQLATMLHSIANELES